MNILNDFKYGVLFDRHSTPKRIQTININTKTKQQQKMCLFILIGRHAKLKFSFHHATKYSGLFFCSFFPLMPHTSSMFEKKQPSLAWLKVFSSKLLLFSVAVLVVKTWWEKNSRMKPHISGRENVLVHQYFVAHTSLSVFLIIHKPFPYVALNAKKIFEKMKFEKSIATNTNEIFFSSLFCLQNSLRGSTGPRRIYVLSASSTRQAVVKIHLKGIHLVRKIKLSGFHFHSRKVTEEISKV